MSRYVSPVFQIDDINGFSQVGAKLVFYTPGTTNLKTIYSDADFSTPITNPVTAVSSNAGAIYPNIYLDGLYDVVQQDATGTVDTDDGATIWTRDNVGETETGQFNLWETGTIYAIPEIVLGSDDEYYRSLTDANQGNDPTTSATNWEQLRLGRIWNTNITYAIGDSVYGSDGQLYICLVSQSGNDPTGDIVNWDESVTASSTSILVNKELTNPKIATGILDVNGNELFKYTATTDAINEITVDNAATGNSPTVTASGDDTNIGLNLVSKGSSFVQENGNDLHSLVLGTPTATTSGTNAPYTSIPSWAKKITVSLAGVSTSGTNPLVIEIGDTEGYETSGYIASVIAITSTVTTLTEYTAAFNLVSALSASSSIHGTVVLTLLDSSTNTWCIHGSVIDSLSTGTIYNTAGSKPLSATLDRLRVIAGGNTLDAGLVNILYEG